MKHLKKLLALLLALALVCGLLPAAFAAPAGADARIGLYEDAASAPDAPAAAVSGDVAIDAANFPDDIFRAFVSDNYDLDKNGALSEFERSVVREMDVQRKDISDLTGIEFFPALKALNCSYNKLQYLDIRKNTALKELHCSDNWLAELDVRKNTALTQVSCGNNYLSRLDLSRNTALTTLWCYGNRLTSLDLSRNTDLQIVSCSSNHLTSLDVSKCTALTNLYCGSNRLTSLDVSGHAPLRELTVSSNQLTSLDHSGCTELKYLATYDNHLSTLDIQSNPKLMELVQSAPLKTATQSDTGIQYNYYSTSEASVYFDPITCIITDERGVPVNETTFPDANFRAFVSQKYDKDTNGWLSDTERNAVKTMSVKRMNMSDLTGISLFPNLTSLECHQNTIGALVLCNPKLTYLKCYDNGMTALDVTGCPALEELRCQNNQLTALDLSNNPALTYLECSDNQLTALELRYNLELTKLYCLRNQLTELKVKGLTKLVELECSNNSLSSLSLQGLISLDKLWCSYNQLSTLDLRPCQKITYLHVSGNPFTFLEIPELPNLARLYCGDCQQTALELPYLPSLIELVCRSNQLTTLDLRSCPALQALDCRQNVLTGLDISGCPDMAVVFCYGNQLPCLDIRSNPTLLNLVQTAALDTSESAYDCYDNGASPGNVAIYFDKGQTLITSGSGVPLDGAHFPDDNFRARVSYLDIDKNSLLSDEERSVDNLYYEDCGIVSLRGIEYFPELTTFSCLNNQLTELDLSGNPKLTSLNCAQNQLTRLDLSGNPLMETVYCYDNQMKALNISGCTELRFLSAFSNQLETLDIRTNPKLVNLIHTVSRKTYDYFGLEYYGYNTDGFESSLAYDKDAAIYEAGEGVLIDAVSFPDDNFREFVRQYDIDSNGFLTDAERNAVTEIDCSWKSIASVRGVELFPELKLLDCDVTQIKELDVSRNTKLTELSCGICSLRSLDVSKNTNLITLYCCDNYLTSLDLSGNTALKDLVCHDNLLTSLDLSRNTALTRLLCYDSYLTSLDLSRNPALTELRCNQNLLTSLDLSRNTALQVVNCSENYLTSLDISRNTELRELSAWSNRIKSLDLRQTPKLNYALGWSQWTGNGPGRIVRPNEFLDVVDYWATYSSNLGHVLLSDTGTEVLFTMNPFTDVKEGKFYYEPVLWAYYSDPQVTAGTDATHFSPTKTCTRGQVVTFLWRAKGCPEPTLTENPFTDVKESAFYYKAVLWAVENNVTTGATPTTFAPGKPCTRAQVVSFLWRAEGSPAPTTTDCPFTDVKTSGFYYEAMLWAVENGVTTGTSATTFGPGKPCTRGQVVSFLQRTVE